MDEKKRNICKSCCSSVGRVAFLIYIIITVAGSNEYLLVLKVLFAGIAAFSYAIKLRIEIFGEEKIGSSIFCICFCLLMIWVSARRLT